MKPDYTKLSPELAKKLEKWEKNNPANRQLQTMGDILDVLSLIDEHLKEKSSDDIGKILVNIAAAVDKIAKKEDAEIPDFAKPIVSELSNLQKELKKIEFKPTINVPEIKAPVVNVPEVKLPTINVPKVDIKPISDVLLKEFPKIVSNLIDAIPTNADMVEALDKLTKVNKEIRDKRVPLPEFPNKMAVTNIDGSPVATSIALTKRYDLSSSTVIYTATAPVGTADSSLGWTITKFDLTNTSDSSGKIATDVSWVNRSLGVYN